MPDLREQLEAAIERRDALYKPAKDTEQGRAMLARLAWGVSQIRDNMEGVERVLEALSTKMSQRGRTPSWVIYDESYDEKTVPLYDYYDHIQVPWHDCNGTLCWQCDQYAEAI